MNFTPDQQKAITYNGNSLLVSAAAGSGKTAVLTERVVQKLLCDKPVMLDRLMILTFTNAAADEMKARINKRLRERLLQEPNNAVIKQQLSLLPGAQISTIHSACLAIVRENFETLGLDPRFSVGDEARLALQKADELYDFAENLYEIYDTDNDAKTVIDAFCRGRDDNMLFDLLDKGSEFLESIAYPELFLQKAENADFMADALEILNSELTYIVSLYDFLINDAHIKAAEFLQSERDSIFCILQRVRQNDFDGAFLCAKNMEFKRYPVCPKKDGADPDEWKEISKGRADIKERFLKVTERFLYAEYAQIERDRQKELPVITSFLNLCQRLNNILLEKRKAERLVSFNDIERYTLSLLIESYDGKTPVKTPLARELSERYDEIIVDEYQDSNDTQDLIFRALSKDEKNIFTVGDVKQSIYRFRGADPTLFLQKQQSYVCPQQAELDAPSKLFLSCNFRSHPKILEFINRVFDMLMTKEHGIDYSDGHALTPSALFDKSDSAGTDITLLVTSDSQKSTSATRVEAEAMYVAKKIKEIIGSEIIFDAKQGVERAVMPRDIAILLRAPKSCGMLFERALEREGLECQNNNPSEKYLDTPEVRGAIAFLQAIDNPYDDIPLITLMYSDCFGFSADELGAIRAGCKHAPFYDAVKESAKTNVKCADFVKMLSDLRALSLTCTVYDLINAVYEKSGMLIRVSRGEGGENRRANLMLLLELAGAYEADRYRGLFAFINYLLKLSENDGRLPSARLKATDNCINLLSIHHSKGLEYPVVFVCNCGAKINTNKTDELLFDTDFGIGGFIREADTHREFSGIIRNIIKHKMAHAELCESIRLLYVALTRAQSRLYITGCMGAADAEKMIIDCNRFSGAEAFEDPSFLKWIILSIINTSSAQPLRAFAGLTPAYGECDAQVHVLSIDEITNGAQDTAFKTGTASKFNKEEIKALITRVPHGVYDVPAKLSVSEIKSFKNAGAGASYKKPRFLQGGVTGADRGNATHKFLQFCNFEGIYDSASFERERERLTEYEFITKTEAKLTDGDKIIEFLTSDIMKTLLKCRYFKEKRFMFTQSARELGIESCDEQIIIQGVIDCYFLTENGAVIVDYKTDRVESEAELLERYALQLDMYERALFVTEGVKTYKKYIYSFALSRFILV